MRADGVAAVRVQLPAKARALGSRALWVTTRITVTRAGSRVARAASVRVTAPRVSGMAGVTRR